ncbi:hypothetical protein M3210_12740 [Oceanobacillus luteolus]|uniref:YtxH domain-containing protein n=1 Tax=Oceanobacillus luteolus TaxID=1274358 RepID=A0ABW4HQX9_9BACI|nr:hypothetical protein [Oceanobacillus luteolus]MCM3741137.1 hypothetical protein [Oceanobacillus luteolus]
MRKRNIITAVGASVLGAGAASYLLMNDERKSKIKDKINNFMNKQDNEELTFEKAGHPDQVDARDIADLENSKMVSEGSQFGVQYYNEKRGETPLQ